MGRAGDHECLPNIEGPFDCRVRAGVARPHRQSFEGGDSLGRSPRRQGSAIPLPSEQRECPPEARLAFAPPSRNPSLPVSTARGALERGLSPGTPAVGAFSTDLCLLAGN
jgi:hypothetical protein